jgi:hypothetical protein
MTKVIGFVKVSEYAVEVEAPFLTKCPFRRKKAEIF